MEVPQHFESAIRPDAQCLHPFVPGRLEQLRFSPWLGWFGDYPYRILRVLSETSFIFGVQKTQNVFANHTSEHIKYYWVFWTHVIEYVSSCFCDQICWILCSISLEILRRSPWPRSAAAQKTQELRSLSRRNHPQRKRMQKAKWYQRHMHSMSSYFIIFEHLIAIRVDIWAVVTRQEVCETNPQNLGWATVVGAILFP